jgi:outer membrane protein
MSLIRANIVLLLLAAFASSAVGADTPGWLEKLREYDLNDYALGVAVTTSQSPYTNAKNSVWAYPYLTTLQHYSLTRDWLVFRRGGIGLRAAAQSGWEIGIYGGIDAGGLGNGDPEELQGLRNREWTLEAGPFVAWRGWPLQIELDTFYDILGRNEGRMVELTFLLPREYEWGYLVPEVGVSHADDNYNNYFFGITEPEVRPGRPLYSAGADTNTFARVNYGYRLGRRWLLSGSVGVEWLGSEITNSPIVDRDQVLSAHLGLAYNADVFNTRDLPYEDFDDPRFEVRVGGFYDNVTTKAQRTGEDGIPGDTIDFENSLDTPDARWATEVAMNIRVGAFHRFEMGYFSIGRDSAVILSDEFRFGDLVIPADEVVEVQSDFSTTLVTYSYSILKDAQKELGLTAGLHFTDFDTRVMLENGESERLRGSVSLPVIGAHGWVALGEKWRVAARLQLFVSDFDRYEGALYYGALEASREVTDGLRVGLGFNLYELRLESARESLRGEFQSRHLGPVLFLQADF